MIPRTSWRLLAGLGVVLASVGLARAESALERGAYLVNAVAACAGCHRPVNQGGGALSGGTRFGGPQSAVYAPNITPDRDTGIGTWSDQQISKAVREGLRPDGSQIGPPMPQRAYGRISDADMAAIVTYLRSVPSVHNVVQRSTTVNPTPAEAGPSIRAVAPADSSESIANGRYLAQGPAHCTECHDADNHGLQRSFPSAHGQVTAPRIDADALRAYSDPQLAAIIAKGVRPDGSALDGPMPVRSYGKMNEPDLASLILYLRQSKAD